MAVDRPQYCKLHLMFWKNIALFAMAASDDPQSSTPEKKVPDDCRTKGGDAKGRCRYAKDAPDDRQFLSSRRHRHRLKIQFEKSNNTAQFAWKCVSRSSSDGIVRRVDTMRPIGGGPPLLDFYNVHRPRLFSTTDSPLPPSSLHMPVLFVSLQFFFSTDDGLVARVPGIIVGALPRALFAYRGRKVIGDADFQFAAVATAFFCTFFTRFQRSPPYRWF